MSELRAVIYARYSSDLQREASIEDQVRECECFANQMGWSVVAVYSDPALSGSIEARPGLQALLAAVRAGSVDVVVAEALDRVSRDQEHVARIFKQLTFSQVALRTIAEGEVSELHVGLKGTMNAIFLKDLAAKIRRGQRGRALAGRSPGGLPYGYDVIRQFGADGRPENGLRSVNEAQAAVVRRIFENYADGMSARQIAKMLNSEGVPSARRGLWNASSIIGNRARRDGILWNEVYIGKLIYNRQRFMMNPETGRRVPRVNPSDQWVIVEAPELRIASDTLWARVHHRLDAKQELPFHKKRGPRRLLSGIIHCGICGGPMTIIGEGRLGCSANKERGTCANGKKVAASRVEDAVLDGIKTQMLQPELIREFANTFNAYIAMHSKSEDARRRQTDKQLAEIDAKVARLLDAMQEGGPIQSLVARLRELERTKKSLDGESRTAAAAPKISRPPNPELTEFYRQQLDSLRVNLTKDEPTRARATGLLRELVSDIEFHPIDGKGAGRLKITGNMDAVVGLSNGRGTTAVTMVAEEATIANS